MCGISAVIADWSAAALGDAVEQLNDLQSHRGPNGDGVHIGSGVALGHRRLSIIDLEGGRQPMSNEDNTVWITFNGEIYNFRELRTELQRAGHQFRSKSDTEVIVHAWEQWGVNCVKHLRGMFAFVIADFRTRQVFVARDPFGIKPVFYRVESDSLVIGSELVAVAAVPHPCLKGLLSSVELFLRFQYVPDPFTIYQNIRKLPSGHYLLMPLDAPVPQPVRYWDFAYGEESTADEVCISSFSEHVDESVAAHLVSDVPFGVFLSGGLDSTCVAESLGKRGISGLKAFCIGFGNEQASEIPYARQVAERAGMGLETETLDTISVELTRRVLRAYGEPFGDSSAIPTWLVSRLASKTVPMVLSGDGGDELFGGYDSYCRWLSRHDDRPTFRMAVGAFRRLRFATGVRSALDLCKRLFRSLSLQVQEWFEFNSIFGKDDRSDLWRPGFQYLSNYESPGAARVRRAWKGDCELDLVQRLDFDTYLPGAILAKVDVASMAHGLEVRTPLIDRSMVGFAVGVPQRLRVAHRTGSRREGKELIKRHLGRIYPESFTRRAKFGFGLPRSTGFMPPLELLRSQISGYLSDWFSETYMESLITRSQSEDRAQRQVWSLYCLACWREEHADVLFDPGTDSQQGA